MTRPADSQQFTSGGGWWAGCPSHGKAISQREVEASASACNLSACMRVSPCLVTSRGLVYDVAGFQHPGGNDLLQPYIGGSIQEAFEDAGHSPFALQQLRGLCVGFLQEEEERLLQQHACTCCNTNREQQTAAAAAAAAAAKDSSTDDEEKSSSSGLRERQSREAAKKQQLQQRREAEGGAHELIEFSKPLVPQVYALSSADYKRAVETPHSEGAVFRLMPWDWLEPATKTHWWVVPLVWLPVAFYLGSLALQVVRPLTFVFAFAFGLFMWSLLEYVLHRFLFHFPEDRLPDSGCCRVVHFLLHAVHHMLPMDPLRLVVPPALLALLSVPVATVFLLVFPRWFVLAAWPGGLSGYVLYDMIHYATHHFAFLEKIGHVKDMKRYHLKHHFKYPLLGFGVSSKFWDFVFRTAIPDN
ncbi:hypothetical protein Efla_005301 [Eimeria flavescens]